MGMYLRNNERKTAADLQHHLCFICGDLFRDRHEYQKHLIVHQSFALVYQIYHFDKTEAERKANEKAKKPDKLGRVGHTISDDASKSKGSQALRQSEELEREMRQRAKGKSRGVDRLEKSHREERRQYLREREREEELQAERERQRKIEAARKRRELRKRKLDEHTAMAAMRDQAVPISKRRPPTRDRGEDLTGTDLTPLHSPPIPNGPSSSSPSVPEVEAPRVTNTGYCIGPLQREKCPYCVSKESFNRPVAAIEHIVDHGGSILDVKLSFYDDDKLLATETQLTGEKCNVCEVNFDFPTQYYLHLLLKHRMEVTSFYIPNYPKANNVKFVTVMIYRMYPEYTIEFREIMPHVAKGVMQQPPPKSIERATETIKQETQIEQKTPTMETS